MGNCVGEDIVLTWQLLSKGYETNFAKNAIAYTEVPEKFRELGKQRKRWARGMIEAFKKVKILSSKKMSLKSKFLMCLNIFFSFYRFGTSYFCTTWINFLGSRKSIINWLDIFAGYSFWFVTLLID